MQKTRKRIAIRAAGLAEAGYVIEVKRVAPTRWIGFRSSQRVEGNGLYLPTGLNEASHMRS